MNTIKVKTDDIKKGYIQMECHENHVFIINHSPIRFTDKKYTGELCDGLLVCAKNKLEFK
jgi:hypothetical protein